MAKSKIGALETALQYVKNKLPQTGFFSTLDELIANAPFEKGPPDQWKNYLQPGRTFEREGVRFPLKKEELDYSGIDYPLSGALGSSLTKNDLRELVQKRRPDLRMKIGVEEGSNALQRFRPEQEIRHNMQMDGEEIDPRYEPQLSSTRYGDYSHEHEPGTYEESRTRSTDFGPFSADHFGPDTISHSRTTVQPTTDDRMMRLVEEIQSDRHQAAVDRPSQAEWDMRSPMESGQGILPPRRGYRTPEGEASLTSLHQELNSLVSEKDERENRELANAAMENRIPNRPLPRTPRHDEINRQIKALYDRVPDAPFKTPEEYGGLELRQQLLNAVKENQDYLGLIRGRDVSDRFSQSKEAASGTSHVYDKVYRSQLEKLARQYGSMVDEVPTSVSTTLDYATPTMRDVDAETTNDFLASAKDMMQAGPGDDQMALDHIRQVIKELGDHPRVNANLHNAAKTSLNQFERHFMESPENSWENNADVSSWWNQLKDDMGDLHRNYIEALGSQSLRTTKNFPAMILTPEIRAKILKAGVPIWALGATGAVGSMMQDGESDEPVNGYADGGTVTLEDLIRGKKKGTTPDFDWIKRFASETQDQAPGSETRNRRMMEGFASQMYGIDADGNVRFMGGDPASLVVPKSMLKAYRDMTGNQQPETYGPGMLDELRALFGSKDADERMSELHQRIQDKLGLQDPHGFQENFDKSLGVMAGQLPIPVKIPPFLKLAKNAPMADRLLQLAKKVISPAAEWLSPTIDPSATNYLTGATFGGGAGALADALAPDQPRLKPLEKAEGGSIKASVKPLRSMLEDLQARFDELTPGMRIASSPDMLAAPIATDDDMAKKIGGYAEGGKVKTLLELRQAMMSKLGGPSVQGTGQELQTLKDDITKGTSQVPTVSSTPDSIKGMVDSAHNVYPNVVPPGTDITRRAFVKGAASLMTPVGGIPLSPEAALAALVKKKITQGITDTPIDHGKNLNDIFLSREDEDYLPESYKHILDQYPDHGPGIFAAMKAVENHLDAHDSGSYENEDALMKLAMDRDQKIGELARHVGLEPNPHATGDSGVENDFEFGSAMPEDSTLRHTPFVPKGTKFVAPYSPEVDPESPHLLKAIDILNRDDPDKALKYLHEARERGELTPEEWADHHEELQDMIDNETDFPNED